MIQNILKSIHTKFGTYIVSIILGLGFASLFRKSCDNKNCFSFRGPHNLDIVQNTFKHNGKCYTFEPSSITCNTKKINVDYA